MGANTDTRGTRGQLTVEQQQMLHFLQTELDSPTKFLWKQDDDFHKFFIFNRHPEYLNDLEDHCSSIFFLDTGDLTTTALELHSYLPAMNDPSHQSIPSPTTVNSKTPQAQLPGMEPYVMETDFTDSFIIVDLDRCRFQIVPKHFYPGEILTHTLLVTERVFYMLFIILMTTKHRTTLILKEILRTFYGWAGLIVAQYSQVRTEALAAINAQPDQCLTLCFNPEYLFVQCCDPKLPTEFHTTQADNASRIRYKHSTFEWVPHKGLCKKYFHEYYFTYTDIKDEHKCHL